MLKKFIDGLIFGCGFSIAFIVIWFIASLVITPIITRNVIQEADKTVANINSDSQEILPKNDSVKPSNEKQFYEVPLEEQISKSSVIALAKFEKTADGKMKAIIKEFLKKDSNTVIHYAIGDEYLRGSYYPSANSNQGDGLVIFFVGSPASMQLSVSYTGNRITGLADLPIELFRKKCQAPNA